MPTENRRVATYLPSQIDAALERFKREKQLKGDSQALILILSEYFGVSSEVAYQSSSQLEQRIAVIEDRLSDAVQIMTRHVQAIADSIQTAQASNDEDNEALASELLSKLQSKFFEPLVKRIDLLETRFNNDQSGNLQLDAGQLELIPQSGSELSDKPESDSLKSMRGVELSNRFGCYKNTVDKVRRRFKDAPERFSEWSQSKDPDKIAWRYDLSTKLYYPVLVSH